MMNSETHRQFYLAAAGIRMWYAKRPLPGAAPSPDYQFTADETPEPDALYGEPEALPTPVVRAKPAQAAPPTPVRPRSVDLQSLMSPQSTPAESRVEEATSPPESEEIAAPIAAEARSAIHANLTLWVTETFVLVSQWSDEASERLQDTLAKNLLSALGQSDAGERLVLRWPVFRNPNIPGNSPADFQQVLSRCLAPYPDRSIILLGVLSDEQQDQREHCLQAALPQVEVDFAHSLAEIAATPAHKRDLWNALKSRYSL
jgi:hypothetical protein